MATRLAHAARGVALLASLCVVAAACGDDEDSDSTATTSSSATAASPASDTTAGAAATAVAGGNALGTPNEASGAPITIGYISDGQSASIDNTDELLAAEATVEYANDYLGGVAGRPIELLTCTTQQDAALATDCGNQMVSAGVPAVLMNVSGQGDAIAKPLQDANIPFVAWQFSGAAAADTESTFVFSNGLSGLVQPATVARDRQYTKAAIIVIDVPAASGPTRSLGGGFLQKAGVAAPDIVAIPPGTADMGPQIQAALSNDPQLVHIAGDAAFCTTALEALDAAGYTGTVTAISQCVDTSTIDAVGDYLEGVPVAYSGTVDPDDPDYQTFVAVIDEYASDPSSISLTSNPVGAFGVVTNFVRAMAGVTGDITPSSVIATLKGNPALPLALGAGLEFRCDGTAVSILPSVCTSGFVQATLDAEGQPTDFEVVEPGDLQSLG